MEKVQIKIEQRLFRLYFPLLPLQKLMQENGATSNLKAPCPSFSIQVKFYGPCMIKTYSLLFIPSF